MEIIGKIVLLLVTLAGYSSGAVLGAWRRQAIPGLGDLALVALLWAGTLATGEGLGRWPALGAWLGAGLAAGGLMGALRAKRFPLEKRGPAHSHYGGSGFQGLRRRWGAFARRMGNFQSRILMMGLYFSVVAPFGLGVRLLSDRLAIRSAPQGSGWVPRREAETGLDQAGRQG